MSQLQMQIGLVFFIMSLLIQNSLVTLTAFGNSTLERMKYLTAFIQRYLLSFMILLLLMDIVSSTSTMITISILVNASCVIKDPIPDFTFLEGYQIVEISATAIIQIFY